jgi:hypothetical protein
LSDTVPPITLAHKASASATVTKGCRIRPGRVRS